MRIFRSFLLFALVMSAYNLAFAQRIGLHTEKWKTITTEHFEVIFSAKQQDLGLYYAHAAEIAYQKLSLVFTKKTEKIVVVINDTTDTSNAFATRIPYPHIMVFTPPIAEHEALSEAGDWAREVITHELTHIMQFEPAGGVAKFLRPILGTIIAPNMLMPLWWKEGMSVELETQFTPRGRLRSTYQDAQLRSFTISESWDKYPLPQANEVLPSWPYGNRPYLFGSLLFSQLTYDTKKLISIDHLTQRQGERVPYFIEKPINELTGSDYETLYNKALNESYNIGKTQLAQLDSVPYSKLYDVPQTNEISLMPRFSNTHHLLAYLESVEGKSQINIQTEQGEKLNLKNLPSGELNGLSFHPLEKKLAYTKIDKLNSKYSWSDLYIYDIETDKSEKITNSQRARTPSFSENGSQLVFVSTFGGQTQIRTVNVKTKAVQFIINSTIGYRYESPIFWNDTTLLASKIDKNGQHRIVKIDLPTKVETPLQINLTQMRFLKKFNQRLYFVSSENGVNNIYRTDDFKTAVPVTHVQSGIWSYDINNEENKAFSSVMTSEGFKVSEVQIKPLKEIPKISNPIAARYTFKDHEYVYKKFKTEDYSAGSYLWPRYWIPFISTSSSAKGVFLQAQTQGQDPIGIHAYSLVASYDSELNKGNFNGIYTNSSFSIPFQISTLTYNRALGTSADIVQTSTHAVSLLPDLFKYNRNLSGALGLQYQNTSYTSDTAHAGPYVNILYADYEKELHQISPEKGWGAFFKLEKNFKAKEDTPNTAIDYEKASFSLIGFTSQWLPKRHAIKAQISGLMTFESVLGRYGDSNGSSAAQEDTLFPQFIARAYAPAQFFGRNLWNANLEYRFPLSKIERGTGSDAYFLKRLSGALIVDGIGVEGFGLTENRLLQSLKLNEGIWGSGLELKLETTIGYILPMNFVLGYYVPHSSVYASSGQLGFSLQLGGF